MMRMVWEDLAFLHWAVNPALLRPLLPPGLELDLYEGQAWLAVVPFFMRDVAPRLWPLAKAQPDFEELNLRTYVRVGDRPGVWFFSLDAGSRLAVRVARRFFHLPYMDAKFETAAEPDGGIGGWLYGSERRHRGEPPASFRARFRPTGPVRFAEPGSLEEFLTERYCLYAHDGRGLVRGDIHHGRWPLQRAETEIERNTLADSIGVTLEGPPLAHFARRLEVVAWWPRPVFRQMAP